MSKNPIILRAVHAMQKISLGAIIIGAVGLIGSALAAAVGLLPWLELTVQWGGAQVANAGMYVQIFAAALVTSMVFFLPTNRRIMELERSHRDFQISMDDIVQAYHVCHTADRADTFTLSSEFDSVRERLVMMRNHPDLQQLEPGILEVAAQMSQQSRQLAEVYSEEKVQRAKDFLRQRQTELITHQADIARAMEQCSELKTWRSTVEVEEDVQAAKIEQLERDLGETLVPLGYVAPKLKLSTKRKVVPMDAGPLPQQA
jgi:hypothetical protein